MGIQQPLLGARIPFEQIVGFGWQTMLGIACAVTLTIVFGLVCPRAIWLMVAETIFIALFVLLLVHIA